MAQRLLDAQAILDAALSDPTLLRTLTTAGYDAARIKEGQTLIAEARARYQQQRDVQGARMSTTDARAASQATAHATYMRHVKTARVALRDDRGAAERLGLAAERRHRLAEWLLQAQQFYANVLRNHDIVVAMGRYGVTEEQLARGQALVNAVATGHSAEQQHKIAAKTATQARDAAFAALDRWMSDFRTMARIALSSQPE